jgi:AcrR family transcriptional regulator
MATRSTRAPTAAPRTFPVAAGLREDQRARRQRIIDVAGRLMGSVDYERIQVKDVADEAGVALGTLYRYFNSKDHLFACALHDWSERFDPGLRGPNAEDGLRDPNAEARVDGADTGSTAERLKAVYRRAARAFERQPRIYGVLLHIQSSTDAHAVEVFRRFARRRSAAFATTLDRSRLSEQKRQDVIAVMNAVLDDNLRAWQVGLQPVAAVHTAIDRAVDLIIPR